MQFKVVLYSLGSEIPTEVSKQINDILVQLYSSIELDLSKSEQYIWSISPPEFLHSTEMTFQQKLKILENQIQIKLLDTKVSLFHSHQLEDETKFVVGINYPSDTSMTFKNQTNKSVFSSYDADIEKPIGQIVVTSGWIKTIRKQAAIIFIAINDGSDAKNIQIVVEPQQFASPELEEIIALSTGSAIQVTGIYLKSPSAGQLFEIQAQRIKSYGPITDKSYPIAKTKLGIDFLRTLPHLRSRTNFFSSINRIRHQMMKATHDFFDGEGFLYLDPNILTINECEGGAGVFTVSELFDTKISTIPVDKSGNIDWSKDHFGKRVYLTVSSQLHLEALALSMGRVYTTNKSFRSEHSLTNKHVSEFSHLEIEQCFTNFEDLMVIAQKYVRYVMKQVYERCGEDLAQLVKVGTIGKSDFIERDFLQRYEYCLDATKAWQRFKYKDAIDLLQAHTSKLTGPPPTFGEDINTECEKFLTEHFGGPVFLTHWPLSIKSFYMKQLDNGTCESFDLLMPGVGELIGASQREENYDKLMVQMNRKGVSPSGLEFYTDLRKFGTAPHGGFGLGLDRFLMFMTGMKNIKDVIPYPVYYTSCNF